MEFFFGGRLLVVLEGIGSISWGEFFCFEIVISWGFLCKVVLIIVFGENWGYLICFRCWGLDVECFV